ncbi:hypothetical protein GCM10010495_18340 [Kitasatospora herbaricolor]|nr:hypothetical protein [Kitasatospora herbaricolor]MDQ0308281.1 hypothetical protein [Kitasatospora herbaricolor]GGV06469.1 hypothetical protein GCM10010495_18340 [Kitasatospora herbaricolor]
MAFTDPPGGTRARVVVRLPAARADAEETEGKADTDDARQVTVRSR